ncbi:tail-specific protease [Pedobacter sp. BS3]|uniref:carboxy terminal-processing peptidase n=1 Tax=Pedobacter sp. BS3 TaxID=2567937 RepID=UPI0011EEA8DE|nr:carboxy terminal-processing peptidase [Pedobacter sp. BS3]TZF80900.1 tail-specific protease [Pedobacter sp. BS3]
MNFKQVKEMLNRIFLTLFIVAAIACKANQRVNPGIEGSNNLQPDAQQGIVAKNLVVLIERYHYKKPVINDSLSSVILDRYLKNLDAGHNYFLASDIRDFEQYRNTMDDDLRNGDLSALFRIFNVFQKRYNERISYSLTQVNNKFNFNDGGTYTYDRSKMPWLSSVADADSLWKHRVQYDLLNLKLTGTEETKNRETLKKRYTNLLSQAKKTNNQDAFQVMMDAFTESIDPHTNYFVPVRAQEFNEEMARTFEGIGARLGLDNEVVKIVEVIPGGPAWRSKQLNANDRIVGVAQGKDGEFEDIIGWRLDNVVAKIKGPKGTIVRLKIIPAGQELTSKPKIVSLVRDKIVLQDQSAKKTIKTVTSNGKSYKIGVITLPAFYADFKAYQEGDPNYKSTSRDVKLLLDTLKQQKVDGVLIDLRTNGGGSLMEAIKLTGLFIKSGPVVQTRDIRGKVDVDEDDDPSVAYSGPLGIMVDRFSASASEIFSGAIQDYGRGIIIGNQTYGKGSVQSAIAMSKVISTADRLMLMAMNKDKSGPDVNGDPFGQINLTTGKFYRINGSSTQHKGVIPDIQFPMIFPADKYGESSEPSAMPWDTIASSTYQPVADLSAVKTRLNALHNKRMETSAEYKYMLQDIERLKKRDAETTVTLNEAKLKKERDEQEAETLARDNQRRALKGLPPLKKGDTKPKDDIDFVQDESLNIMADLIKLGK